MVCLVIMFLGCGNHTIGSPDDERDKVQKIPEDR